MIIIIITIIVVAAVMVTPKGPLVVKVNTAITINCTMMIGVAYSHWEVIHKNKAIASSIVNEIVPGVTVTIDGQYSSSVFLNTNDRAIVGFVCIGSTFDGPIRARINITIRI